MSALPEALLRLTLSPLLLLNLIWVLLRVKRFPEADGPREGIIGEGPELRLLIVGDSSSVGVGLRHQDQALAGHVSRELAKTYRVTWRVIGTNGITTGAMLRWLPSQNPQPADLVLIALGVNDTKNGVPLMRWLDRYREIVTFAQTELGAHRVIASGLPPIRRFTFLPQPLRWVLGRRADAFDIALQRLCRETGARHISLDFTNLGEDDMAEDGFHPGPPVYAAWAGEVRAALEAR